MVGLLAIIGAAGAPADSPSGTRGGPAGRGDVEWVQITYGDETRVDVAVFRPEGYSDSGSHPLILALPWGAGTPGLVLGMVDAYWNTEASRRGYIVVSPSIRGSSLGTEADRFLPALFSWLDDHL